MNIRAKNHRPVRNRIAPAAFALCLLIPLFAVAPPPAASGARGERLPRAAANMARVNALLHALTLDEKVSLLTGWPGAGAPDPSSVGQAGFVPGVPRLGIPRLRFTDGPAGVRNNRSTTALPAPVSLAASFGTQLANEYGVVLGRDAQATDQDVLFGPMVNLVRVPQAGRNFETLGEDPLLQSDLVSSEVGGIQSQGTISTVKHLAANNQEDNRRDVDAKVDDRTLHEMELPPFEAAVRAGAGAVMCAYPLVNGVHSCASSGLLTDVLRVQWRFKGWVLSDFGAALNVSPGDVTSGRRSAAAAAALELRAGLDMEFDSSNFAGVKTAVMNHVIPESVVDGAVRRILTTLDRFGLLDHTSTFGAAPVTRARPNIDVQAEADVARVMAESGAVLLKNDAHTLPLSGADLRSLAVIGPTARQPLVGGRGSAHVVGFTDREVSPLNALRLKVPDADIRFAVGHNLDGVPVPRSALTAPGGPPGSGLLRTDATTGARRVDSRVDLTGANALAPDSRVTWTGTLRVPTTGSYDLKVQTSGGSGSFTITAPDGSTVASGSTGGPFGGSVIPTTDGLSNSTGIAQLMAGILYRVSVTASADARTPLQIRFAWTSPELRRAEVEKAVKAARQSRTAIVFAYNEGTEGDDRPSLSLPGEQDDLIASVAAANPNTIVVLNTGDPVVMPWINGVRSVLEMWYPGQEGGRATADVLLGVANPSGKLPVTFPAREADTPVAGLPERYPGVPLAHAPPGQTVEHYSEGIMVGYRWYDRQNIRPLFPFGAGLSYTNFSYSHLQVLSDEYRDAGFDVTFVVENTGSQPGTEVAQVYVGPPPTQPVPMADKALAGFQRITLKPGQAEQVTVHVQERQLSYWSTTGQRWVVAAGQRPIYVGSSSREILLSSTALVSEPRSAS